MLEFPPLDGDKLSQGIFFIEDELKVKRYQMVIDRIVFWYRCPFRLWASPFQNVKRMGNVGLLVLLGFSVIFNLFFEGPVRPVQTNPRSVVPTEFFQLDYYIARLELLKMKLPSYFVLPGETLYSIARKYLVSLKDLQELNKIKKPDKLIAGRRLYIPTVTGAQQFLVRHRIHAGETLEELLKTYRLRDWEFQRLNPQIVGKYWAEGTDVWLPRQGEPVSRGGLRSIRLLKPVDGRLTSPFGLRWGKMHWGMDLATHKGTPVKAAAAGEVIFAGWRGSYGLLVVIKHGKFLTYYGHLSQIYVSEGDRLQQGDFLGEVGSTGRAYGDHLHFELEVLGQKINPAQFLF